MTISKQTDKYIYFADYEIYYINDYSLLTHTVLYDHSLMIKTIKGNYYYRKTIRIFQNRASYITNAFTRCRLLEQAKGIFSIMFTL